MKAEFVGRENNEVTFTMEFSAEEFEAAIQKAYLQERGKIAIDGFRKGKAPRSIIERKYGSSVFFDTAIDNLFKENYAVALDELKIDPVDNPDVKFGDEKFEQGKGFKATLQVTVAPEVELKEYKGLKIEFEPRKVEDADVEAELENMQKRNARLLDSEEAAKLGDTVVLDYAGFVGDEQFVGGTAEGYSLKLGSNTFIPGFEDQLVGVKAGESKDVVVTFPEEYQAEALAGKEATFKCTVHEVKIEELPALDDEFAKDVSSFDTLDELKADIKANLQKKVDDSNDYEGKNKALLALCDANELDIPAAMIDDEVNQMYNEYLQRLINQGVSAEAVRDYLKNAEADLKENFRPDAEVRVKTNLLIKAVAEAEKIEATEEDIQKEYEIYADMYQTDIEEIKKAMVGSEEYLKEDIVYRKATDFVYENAKLSKPKAKKAAKKEEKTEDNE